MKVRKKLKVVLSIVLSLLIFISSFAYSTENQTVSNPAYSAENQTVSNSAYSGENQTVSNSAYSAENQTVSNSAYSTEDQTVSNSTYSGENQTVSNSAYSAEDQTVSLQVYQQRNIEIALALGDSNLEVSGFENDIKAELLNTYGISGDRVKVTAVQAATVDAKNQFDWEIYDHYYDPSYPKDGSVPSGWSGDSPYFYYAEDYPAGATFFTDVSESDNSLKGCYNRSKHIYPKGNDIYFLGISAPAFKDFMLYQEPDRGKKTIEFTIEESKIDTHTLEGAGFLFNTGMTTDSNGVARLNGYLLLYDYSNAYFNNGNWAGKKINLYRLNNVNATTLHQEQQNPISQLATNGTSGITLLASKNSQSTSETLNIKIEAMTTGFKLFEDSNTIYDTTGPDSAITLNDSGAYGFGPFVSYGSHGCSSLTYFTYKNIRMTNETAKSFLDIIREPAWQNNSKKFIVNLDDNGVADFQDGQKLSEILYRMLNQDIHYLGWGNNDNVPDVSPTLTNEQQANSFIANNDGKGLFVNQCNEATDSYQKGIAAIAKYINDNVQTPDKKYILLDDPYKFVINPPNLSGTWRIDHDPTVYSTNKGAVSWDNQTLTTFPTSLGKNGKYEVFYNDGATEQKIADIYAAWRPVASLSYTPASKSLTDKSYDPNGMALTQEWKWKKVFDSTWTDGKPDPAVFDGTSCYLVQLRVQNADGVWSLPSTIYITNNTNARPIAAFTLPTNQLDLAYGVTSITPANTSFSPSGGLIDAYKWEVYNSKDALILSYNTENPVIDFINLPKDIYSIKLSVRSGTEWSEVFTQTLTLMESDPQTLSLTLTSPTEGAQYKVGDKIPLAGTGTGFSKVKFFVENTVTKQHVWIEAEGNGVYNETWNSAGWASGNYLVKMQDTVTGNVYDTANIILTSISHGGSHGGGTSPPQNQPPKTNDTGGATNLTDIAGHWAQNDIVKLVDQGVITGYPDGTFRPDANITRAEFVTVLVKAFKLDPVSDGKIFADTDSHWAKEYVAAAVYYGICNGYDTSHFGPDDLITREQMAAMVIRAAKLKSASGTLNFTDSGAISPWAIDSVNTAVADGIIRGYPDNTFKPQGNATRAEAVTVLVNALALI